MPAPVKRRSPFNVKLLLAVSLLCIGLIAAFLYFRYRNPTQIEWDYSRTASIRIPTEYPVHGIDVSKHQGKIEWSVIRESALADEARLEFVFIKATEGISIQDKRFKNNYSSARQTGLRVGAYHFFIPWRDPVPQADNFIETVQLKSGDLPPVLDVESSHPLKSDERTIRDIRTWLELVEKEYGVKPIIYTNRRFYQKFIRGNFDEYPLWLAHYSSEQLAGDISGKVWFWQYSELGQLKGIKGKVDYNAFLGDLSELEQICLP
ncbi:glycoside hydrolase [Siphonobacter sp. BAB-5385]|uniref:glycoside hydrolase family 25 protein n=1 Tax=Siphonobacter sp. BAB-5385 TaxID=1864822 RepID=UPI000B9DD97B|nr:GH25 family lysozyme [Siphonobacter sp. BAB-5385]OZI08091.1 glycoside hydrolase [Siphonobacter sp. BAB-5385]